MNNNVKTLIFTSLGFVTGFFIAKVITDRKWEARLSAEIDLAVEADRKIRSNENIKKAVDIVSGTIKNSNNETTPEEPEDTTETYEEFCERLDEETKDCDTSIIDIVKNFNKENRPEGYEPYVSPVGFSDEEVFVYPEKTDEEKEEPEETEEDNDEETYEEYDDIDQHLIHHYIGEEPYVITEEEYGDIKFYETDTLYYFVKDNILTFSDFKKVSDIDYLVGESNLEDYDWTEESGEALYIRNDGLRVDLKIIVDFRTYSKVVKDDE